MPLHDWSALAGWEGMHHLWIASLLRDLKPRLPEGYRAYLGSAPMLSVEAPGKPDLEVRSWSPDVPASPAIRATSSEAGAPDVEVAVAVIDPGTALLVENQGILIAAVDLVSPRNKYRPTARETFLARYLGYVLNGANLVLVDVHPRRVGFSFADQIAEELHLNQPPCPAPMAIAYRVGEPAATGGRMLAIWRRPMVVGDPLPAIPLPLTVDLSVPLDLERTYAGAAEDAYLT